MNEKLKKMVLDAIEINNSATFEEMLENLDSNNFLYNELKRASEVNKKDRENAFALFQVWAITKMEHKILDYLYEIV